LNLDVGLGTTSQSGPNGANQRAYQDASASGQTKVNENEARALAEIHRLDGIEKKIKQALKKKGLDHDVRFKVTDRGLVVALVSDDVFFENASAALRPRGVQVLAAVAPAVRGLPNDIAVEGHANRLKITSGIYPTNWELSAARAAGVVRWLIGHGGIPATKLSATGYGSSRPLFPASDQRSITFNRRVDIVLVSNESPEVRALLPRLGSGLSTF
jgi:chemotaxis protein MotB